MHAQERIFLSEELLLRACYVFVYARLFWSGVCMRGCKCRCCSDRKNVAFVLG